MILRADHPTFCFLFLSCKSFPIIFPFLSCESKPFPYSIRLSNYSSISSDNLAPMPLRKQAIRLEIHEFSPAGLKNLPKCASILPTFPQKIMSPLPLVQIKFSISVLGSTPCHLFKELEPLIFYCISCVLRDLANTLLPYPQLLMREGNPWSLQRGSHVLYHVNSCADWNM